MGRTDSDGPEEKKALQIPLCYGSVGKNLVVGMPK